MELIKQAKQIHWGITELWSKSLQEEFKPKEYTPRDYLYASELGFPMIDAYYKMKGIKPSNEPTAAAKMKMEAGKMFESVLLMVFLRAGLLKSYQEKIKYALDGCIEVSGKLDYIVGGKPDYEQAADTITLIKFLFEKLCFPTVYLRFADNIITWLTEMKEKQPDVELMEYILDCKSVSAFVYELIERTGKVSLYHLLQLEHYLFGLKKERGKLIYINRDDIRKKELHVNDNPETFNKYKNWVEEYSNYWLLQQAPPKEPLVVFNYDTGQFYKNTVGVEWSRYLTLLYNFNSPMDFREAVKYVKSWNTGLNRYVLCELGGKTPTGKVMQLTDNNKNIKAQIIASGYDFNKLIETKIRLGAIEGEEEITE